MLSIGTNTGAIMAQAAASSVTRDMETAMHRLSTGKRINAAADDAAGVAISSRLDSTVRGLNQSIRNALDAQALIDTAEGGMQETETILQRIRELSIQAANDTNSADDRANLNAEAQSLLSEIDRISSSTTWAGQSLLDGTFTDKSFQVGTGTMAADQLVTSIAGVSGINLGLAVSTELITTPEKFGNEFQVNETHENAQTKPSVAAFSDSSFVVVYSSRSSSASREILGQRFQSDGTKLGDEFTVSDQVGDNDFPIVQVAENDSFTVTWRTGSDYIAQPFNSDASKWGPAISANSISSTATFADNTTIQVHTKTVGLVTHIYGQKYKSDGTETGVEFRINVGQGSNNKSSPQIQALENGSFAVVWQDRGADGDDDGIFGQLYDYEGNPLDADFAVNTYTSSVQSEPKITNLRDGGFVVSWSSWEQDGSEYGIYGQRFAKDGSKVGSEFLMNSEIAGSQSKSSLAQLDAGRFVAVWNSAGDQDGHSAGIFAQIFESEKNKITLTSNALAIESVS